MRGLKLNRGYTFQNYNDNHQMLVFKFLRLLDGTHKRINVEIGWSQLRYETVAKHQKFQNCRTRTKVQSSELGNQATVVRGFTTDHLLI